MRINYRKLVPEPFAAMAQVLESVKKKSGIPETTLHMVYLRTSQINGCPYCIDLHWRDATKAGADARALNAVQFFRDAPFFSEKEKAALEWAECVTAAHKDQQLIQPIYDRVRSHYDDVQLSHLTYAISQMNAFNRLAIAFHVLPQT